MPWSLVQIHRRLAGPNLIPGRLRGRSQPDRKDRAVVRCVAHLDPAPRRRPPSSSVLPSKPPRRRKMTLMRATSSSCANGFTRYRLHPNRDRALSRRPRHASSGSTPAMYSRRRAIVSARPGRPCRAAQDHGSPPNRREPPLCSMALSRQPHQPAPVRRDCGMAITDSSPAYPLGTPRLSQRSQSGR